MQKAKDGDAENEKGSARHAAEAGINVNVGHSGNEQSPLTFFFSRRGTITGRV